MLAASQRLRHGRDITRVYSKGRSASAGALSVRLLANHQAHSRGVVVVSKKVSKKAVVRNRLRRRLAALLAENWQTLRPGYDIVVTMREDVSDAPSKQLADWLHDALHK